MVEALNTLDFGRRCDSAAEQIHSKFFKGDMEATCWERQTASTASCCRRRAAPKRFARSRSCSTTREARRMNPSIQIESLIETPHALIHAYEIATASDRMCGLVFGIADYAANLGIREIVENQNQNFHYSKQAVVVAAKAAGLHAIDNVYLRLWRKKIARARRGTARGAAREESALRTSDGRHLGDSSAAGRNRNRCYTPNVDRSKRRAA